MTQVRDTSIAALREISDSGLLSRRRFQIYCALYEHGPCTAGELFHKMNLAKRTQSNVTTRLGELRDLGVAQEVGKRKCSITGMTVLVWDVTSALPRKKQKEAKTPCLFCGK